MFQPFWSRNWTLNVRTNESRDLERPRDPITSGLLPFSLVRGTQPFPKRNKRGTAFFCSSFPTKATKYGRWWWNPRKARTRIKRRTLRVLCLFWSVRGEWWILLFFMMEKPTFYSPFWVGSKFKGGGKVRGGIGIEKVTNGSFFIEGKKTA